MSNPNAPIKLACSTTCLPGTERYVRTRMEVRPAEIQYSRAAEDRGEYNLR